MVSLEAVKLGTGSSSQSRDRSLWRKSQAKPTRMARMTRERKSKGLGKTRTTMRPLVGRNRREGGEGSVHILWYVCTLIRTFRNYLLQHRVGVPVLWVSAQQCVHYRCLRAQCERTKRTLYSPTQGTNEVGSTV